jgi:3-deoxy-D-manno-octulosonic-acid transferase
MGIVYAFIIHIYGLAIRVASLFNEKAKDRITGLTKQQKSDLQKLIGNQEIIWMHCASVGEFEQGRPVFESLKKQFPHCFFLLTFFSASGFNATQKYKQADLIVYLPLDTKKNAKDFLGNLNFKMALFIKYEFWFAHLGILHQKKIPTYFISVIFRPTQLFFKNYGGWFLQHLKQIDYFFVQDEASKRLLQQHGIRQVEITGDTRSDRVLEVSKTNFELIKTFNSENSKTIVCGSIWPEDEIVLIEAITNFQNKMKWILVPHEINSNDVLKLKQSIEKASGKAVKLFSELSGEENFDVLIFDAIGYLSKLYRLGDMAYVGGGFGKGIHNLLEAAVYGIPVMFGPKNEKFREAAALKKGGGGFEIGNVEDLNHRIERWLGDDEQRKRDGEQALRYLMENSGATDKILEEILKRGKERI